MCFRPMTVDNYRNDIQRGECPTCGMPVAAKEGVSSGTCPHCGSAIPPEGAGTPPSYEHESTRII